MNAATSPEQVAPNILALFPEESEVAPDGVLTIGGCRVDDLAVEHGTPAYLIDESGLRKQIRRFIDGLAQRWPNSEVLFASKSLPCVAMYALAESEGLSVDVAGAGELVMALAAGVDPNRIYLHGNAKSDAEIDMALEAGIRCVIVDNFDDLDRLERLATKPQAVLIRLIPGVSPATHSSMATGGHSSKFGLPLDQLAAAQARIARSELLHLEGVHLHIGSQVLETEPFVKAVEAVSGLGPFPTYDVGGGLGVRYTYAETAPTVEEYLDAVTSAAKQFLPANAKLLIEPGRSIVARAGVTLYKVTTVKNTGKTFVAIDGGLADNLDIALTGQRYEAVVANKMHAQPSGVCDVVGRQCESGDLMVGDVPLADPRVGDLIAMPVTGAYAYTMANNYNGALIPPVVFCANGNSTVVAERQSYEDLLRPHRRALKRQW
ncbi:diaminopimelate decarboxylase [Arthrobacter sp. RHLT1-20]